MNQSILLVSPPTEHLSATQRILAYSGLYVFQADSVDSAKAGLASHSPAFLLVDLDAMISETILTELLGHYIHTRPFTLASADFHMQIMMVNRGISVSDISPKIISEYVAGLAEYSKATIEVHLRGLRQFFRFLYDAGETAQDLSASVPKLHGGTGERIPHILSAEQVHLLLDSVDRGSPIGKRNYAILMMAACLGMRDSDIRESYIFGLPFDYFPPCQQAGTVLSSIPHRPAEVY